MNFVLYIYKKEFLPFHSDEVPEPLMCELVANDDGNPLFSSCGSILGVDKETGLAVGDQAPVLHGARAEVGNGDQVDLGQGIGDVEVLLIVGQHLGGDFQRETSLILYVYKKEPMYYGLYYVSHGVEKKTCFAPERRFLELVVCLQFYSL